MADNIEGNMVDEIVAGRQGIQHCEQYGGRHGGQHVAEEAKFC